MSRWLPVLLLSVSGLHIAVAEDSDDLILEEDTTQEGKGVIIELEDEEPGKPVAKKKNTGRKQVELIVGGQGEDGIAKRGTLKVED